MLAGLLIAAVSLAAVLLFTFPPAWFPVGISPEALLYDSQFHLNLIILGVLFLISQIALVAALMRRNTGPRQRGWPRMESAFAVCISVVFAILGITGARNWTGAQLQAAQFAAPATEVIEVYAHQFAWSFRYPGPDGKFGKTDVTQINDAALNPIGLTPDDPAGRDDIISALLRVPAGKPILLKMRARDVIHDFFVRELRLKQDLVPGIEMPYRFQADRIGRYEIACAALCGLGHSQMRGVMQVMAESDYQAWKRSQIHP